MRSNDNGGSKAYLEKLESDNGLIGVESVRKLLRTDTSAEVRLNEVILLEPADIC